MPLPRSIFYALLFLTVLRAVLAGTHELTPTEAHLWQCAERPAANYVDFGPLAPLIVKLGVLVGGKTPLAVRWLAPALAFVVSLIIFRLASSLFDQRTATWSVVVLNLTPLFNAAGILFLPSTIGFAAWVAALWAIWRALHRAAMWNWYWPLAGLYMGLGMLSTPANWLQPLCLILLLVGSRRWRRQLRRPGVWLAVAISAVMSSPVFWWHSRQGWLVWRWHLHDLTRDPKSARFLCSLGEMTVGLSPILAAGTVWALCVALRRLRLGRHQRATQPDVPSEATVFLLAFSIPTLLVASLLAIFGGGALAVSAVAFFGLTLLLVAYWLKVDFSPGTVRLAQNATLCVAAAYSVVLAQSDLWRHWGMRWPYRFDPSARARGWHTSTAPIAEAMHALENESRQPVFVIAGSPALAASLNFHWPPNDSHPSGHLSPRVQAVASPVPDSDFAFWPRYDFVPNQAAQPLTGAAAIFVGGDDSHEFPPPAVRDSFRRINRLGAIEVMRGGQPLRRLTLFACYDYRGPSM